jgi:hypothetical protein
MLLFAWQLFFSTAVAHFRSHFPQSSPLTFDRHFSCHWTPWLVFSGLKPQHLRIAQLVSAPSLNVELPYWSWISRTFQLQLLLHHCPFPHLENLLHPTWEELFQGVHFEFVGSGVKFAFFRRGLCLNTFDNFVMAIAVYHLVIAFAANRCVSLP